MKRANRLELASKLALVTGLLVTFAAGAQQGAVARLKSVTGNVLVSQESGLATGSQSQRLSNGTRIITTANSEAIVEFDNGCEVRLKENQRFEVDRDKPCAALLPVSLGGPAAVGAPFANTLVPALLVGAIGTSIVDNRQRDPVSPN